MMIEHEHPEICQADIEEREFTKRCVELLHELKAQDNKTHPLITSPLPRAAPKAQRTHRLEYDPRTKEYTPVPIIPQYQRDGAPGGEPR